MYMARSGKFEQHVRMYAPPKNGYKDGEAMELSDNFKATVALKGLCAQTRLCRRQEAPSEGLCVGSR